MTKGKIYQLSRYGNVLVTNAAVTGNNNQVRKIKLLVDTGSSYTVIRSTLLKSIGYESQQPLFKTYPELPITGYIWTFGELKR